MSTSLVIELPPNIIAAIGKDIEGTSFTSVEDFIQKLVLQKYPELQVPVYTDEEEELIKERLRRLGYLE